MEFYLQNPDSLANAVSFGEKREGRLYSKIEM
jgi:hypothetical protein